MPEAHSAGPVEEVDDQVAVGLHHGVGPRMAPGPRRPEHPAPPVDGGVADQVAVGLHGHLDLTVRRQERPSGRQRLARSEFGAGRRARSGVRRVHADRARPVQPAAAADEAGHHGEHRHRHCCPPRVLITPGRTSPPPRNERNPRPGSGQAGLPVPGPGPSGASPVGRKQPSDRLTLTPMPRKSLYLSGNPDADALLGEDPLALVIGMVLDQQVRTPWSCP